MKKHREHDIIEALRAGDRLNQNKLLEEVYANNYMLIQKFIKKNSGNELDAKDVFQDAIIILYNQSKKEDFILSSSIQTYLYSVCRNLWLFKLRKRKKVVELKETYEFVDMDYSAVELLEEDESKIALMQLVNKLNCDCKKVLSLFYFENLPMKEISKLLNYSNEQIAKNKKYKCMKQLKKIVSESDFFQRIFK